MGANSIASVLLQESDFASLNPAVVSFSVF